MKPHTRVHIIIQNSRKRKTRLTRSRLEAVWEWGRSGEMSKKGTRGNENIL